MQHTKIGHE